MTGEIDVRNVYSSLFPGLQDTNRTTYPEIAVAVVDVILGGSQ